MKALSDLVEGGIKGLVTTVSDTVDKFTLQKEEKAAIIEQFQNSARQFELELNSQIVELEKIESERVADARQLQIEALKQEGWLAKNFIYLLSIFAIVNMVICLIVIITKVIPEDNRMLFQIYFDFSLFGAAAAVYNFFLGSSMGSKKKQDLLAQTQHPNISEVDETLLSERQKRKRMKEENR